MLTAMPPSSLWQRMKRSPNGAGRTESSTIVKLKARTYHSAVARGSDDFRWMWLMRYGIHPPPRRVTTHAAPAPAKHRRRARRRASDRRDVELVRPSDVLVSLDSLPCLPRSLAVEAIVDCAVALAVGRRRRIFTQSQRTSSVMARAVGMSPSTDQQWALVYYTYPHAWQWPNSRVCHHQ